MNDRHRNTNHPSQSGHPASMLYGLHPVIEALTSGKDFERILIQQNLQGELVKELIQLIRKYNVPVQTVPVEKLNRTVRGNHQGVIGFMAEITYQPIENLLMSAFESGKLPLFIILDRITDVRNLGAIARTAECAGAHAIIVPSRGSALITADAIKTSSGALNRIPVHRSENLKDTVRYLRFSGLTILAASEKGSKTYFETDLKRPLAIILGSEEDGISEEYLKLSDEIVSIPLAGQIASLNVSVAAGVIMFETLRQRSALTIPGDK